MPVYDYSIDGMGIRRVANDCSLDGLVSHLTHDLRYIDFDKVTITIIKKRGTPKSGD